VRNREARYDRARRSAWAPVAVLAACLAAMAVPAPASAVNVDADTQNVVTLNALDGQGNEIPITSGGVRSVEYDTSAYTLQSAAEGQRTGCVGFGNRTAWVRFIPGVRGRLSVTASAAYDVQLFSYFTTLRRGETGFDPVTLVTDNCNNATSGPNELNMPVPVSSAQDSTVRVKPGDMILLQSASWCDAAVPNCAGGAGGQTTLSVNFIPDDGDADGVPDSIDACQNTAGPAALGGCPDRDGDAVRDIDDACPDTAGVAGLAGCPDRDADGVRDSDDACPDVAGLAGFGGCPDRDGDGVPAPPAGGDCDDAKAAVRPGAIEIPGNGVDDDCAGGDAPRAALVRTITVDPLTVSQGFARYIRIVRFSLSVPGGSRISLRCSSSRVCKRYARTMPAGRRRTVAMPTMRSRVLRPGQWFEVRVTRPGWKGRYLRYTNRGRRLSLRRACIAAGAPTARTIPCA
jgi:Putative metal-binding motif